MSDPAVGNNQAIVSFVSQGDYSSIDKAVRRVALELQAYLSKKKTAGENPIVVSISQSSGFDGHIGYYASIIAVINE